MPDAPPDEVWSVLAALDVLHEYDPGIAKSKAVSAQITELLDNVYERK